MRMLAPAAHQSGDQYRYLFAIYQDCGPKRTMPFLRYDEATGPDRAAAFATLRLAPDERAIWHK